MNTCQLDGEIDPKDPRPCEPETPHKHDNGLCVVCCGCVESGAGRNA